MTQITPEIIAEHGLSETEYGRIVKHLDRDPNLLELGLFSVMWSEHCSYKSSRRHLKKFPTEGAAVIQGPGENAGVVDIGDGPNGEKLAAIFKMESHNHPSFIEPYQGAATGVGGILRDVFTMGARPVANLNALRFGALDHPKTKHLVSGVVAGIGGYGNCVGVPTVAGETNFDPRYNGNILVNAMTVGVAQADKIFYSAAKGAGNPVVYVGSKTGRDGIHGATMASAEFAEDSEEKRPTVQVGDPFTEKLLIEACLELMAEDAIIAIQDMGAAGLTSSSIEMAAKGEVGIELILDDVPQREENMTAYEMMLSESQERMLMVLQPGREDAAKAIFDKWGLDFAVIGATTDTGRMILKHKDETVADLPISPLADDAPNYDRPFDPVTPPAALEDPTQSISEALITITAPDLSPKAAEARAEKLIDQKLSVLEGVEALGWTSDAGAIKLYLRMSPDTTLPNELTVITEELKAADDIAEAHLELAEEKVDLADQPGSETPITALLELMASPDLCSRRWIWEQYDSTVMGDTVSLPGGDAGVVRIHGTDRGLAMTTDVTPRYCAADPHTGGRQAVAEAWRNLTATGADPIAITNCLNFGNPERPDVMGQFVGCVEGMAEACRALDFPVVSGNVSLYNETNGEAILPTPTVGGVGVIKDLAKRGRIDGAQAGDTVILIGHTKGWLGQSLYMRDLFGVTEGAPPPVNFGVEQRNGEFARGLLQFDAANAVHDVSDGGALVAIAEMCLASGVGATLTTPVRRRRAAFWFGEDQARYVVAVPGDKADAILLAASRADVSASRLGKFGGDDLVLDKDDVADLMDIWMARETTLADYMAPPRDEPKDGEPQMPMKAEDIESMIKEAMPDAEVEITDLAGDGDHYKARIVSSVFAGKSRVQQHQLVYGALKGKMGGELHALALETSAPPTE